MRADLLSWFYIVQCLSLSPDKRASSAFRQTAFIPTALAKGVNPAKCHVSAVKPWFLVEGIHGSFSLSFFNSSCIRRAPRMMLSFIIV